MIPFTLREIANIINGQILNATGDELVTAPPFIDTRDIVEGGIFAAFMGEKVDGHNFAADAIRGGATAAILTRDVGVPSIQVPNVEAALQTFARYLRSILPNLKVIGITGSQGKTTTKDLLFAILSSVAPTIAPPGSHNNDLGVPLTLLRCSEDTKFCIVEMGARHRGDIARLAGIAQVDIGAVLNIGTAHIGEFGSSSALARAKGELIEALEPEAKAILGSYDQPTRDLIALAKCSVTTFGESSDAEVKGEQVSLIGGRANFLLVTAADSREVHLNYYGRHQVANALAAAAIAVELGIKLSRIADELSTAVPASRWRMEVRERGTDGVTIINDAYNANPESMAAAIELLAEWASAEGRPSWAVLGQMRELGASSVQGHQLIGRLVAERGISHLLVVGAGAGEILNGVAGMVIADAKSAADSAAALRYLRAHVEPGALVLVKASRAEGLERIAQDLASESS
jgi:UDP-N-acetylmuramoyl-tripeptide--D-alanyl-D-alanine ligase